MELSQMIDGFFLVRRTRLATSTQRNYRNVLKRFTAHIGASRLIETITANDVRAYANHIADSGLSERTIHDTLTVLSSLWSFAALEFGIENIMKRVEKPNYTKKEIIPFSEDEVKRILAQAEWTTAWSTRHSRQVRSHRPTWRRDVALIMLLLDTGLRAAEACGLLVSDYQQDTGRLLVRHGKGNKQRIVYLGATAQRTLWRYMMSRNRVKPSDPIFATRGNKPLDRGYVFHLVRRIGDNANIPHVHPHRFRHTFAIEFLRNGGNVFELQRILGHSELDTVKIYLNIAQVDLERAQKANSPADNWRL